jgi:predicted phosphohydrolase
MTFNNLLQVCSDIHLERNGIYDISNIITPNAEILVLAGDIGNPMTPIYNNFLDYYSKFFKIIFIITGNHEYYGNTIIETDKKIEEICNSYDNIHFLNNKTFRYEGILFIGTTLWSSIPKYYTINNQLSSMNDFKLIKDFTLEEQRNLFIKNVKFIKDNLEENTIIITHHAPSMRCIAEEYKYDKVNCCFASDLDELFMNDKVIGWIYGHTHNNLLFITDKKFMYSNCYRTDNYNKSGTII